MENEDGASLVAGEEAAALQVSGIAADVSSEETDAHDGSLADFYSASILTLPDNVLVFIFSLLHDSRSTNERSTLHTRKLLQATDSNALAFTCKRLFHLFRDSVAALQVNWDDPVAPGIVSFFAPGLTSLTICHHPQSIRFVRAADGALLKALCLINCPVDHVELCHLIQHTRDSLQEFSLTSIQSTDVNDVGRSIDALSRCRFLRKLTLHQVQGLREDILKRAFANSLRELSLMAYDDSDFSNATLHHIPLFCPQLQAIALYNARWAAPSNVVTMCTSLRENLLSVNLENCGISNDVMLSIAKACPRIHILNVSDDSALTVSADGVVLAASAMNSRLFSATFDRTMQVIDQTLSNLCTAAPNLVDIRLRYARSVTDQGISSLMNNLKSKVEVLDITGCSITDNGLHIIGKAAPPRLRALLLGARGTGRHISWQQLGQPVEPLPTLAITDAGIDVVLKAVGNSLRRFHCEYVSSQPGELPKLDHAVTSVGIVQSLTAHCKNLEICCLLNISPPLSKFTDRRKAREAIQKLEDIACQCVVYIDREPPALESLTLGSIIDRRRILVENVNQ